MLLLILAGFTTNSFSQESEENTEIPLRVIVNFYGNFTFQDSPEQIQANGFVIAESKNEFYVNNPLTITSTLLITPGGIVKNVYLVLEEEFSSIQQEYDKIESMEEFDRFLKIANNHGKLINFTNQFESEEYSAFLGRTVLLPNYPIQNFTYFPIFEKEGNIHKHSQIPLPLKIKSGDIGIKFEELDEKIKQNEQLGELTNQSFT